MSQTGFLVLAAGFHRRFGAPKLLQPLADDRPLIQHTLQNICATGLPVALVHKPDDQALLQAIESFSIKTIASPNAEQGMGSSLSSGIKNCRDWNGWIICLADMPLIQTQTYNLLAEALIHSPIVIPTHQKQNGHPRGFQSVFIEKLCALKGDNGAREIIESHKNQLQLLEVNDPGILVDVDHPQDIHDLLI